MKLILAAFLLAAGALPARAEDPSETRFQTWVADLGSEEFAVREAAHKELLKLGSGWKSSLEQAIAGATDAEFLMRLRDVLSRCGRPAWRTDLEGALETAKRENRPILILSTVGDLDGYS